MKKYRTLVEALHNKSVQKRGIRLLNNSKDTQFLSYADLLKEAERYLTVYQAIGVQKGDELVLQFTSIRSFLIAYWACLLGGIIPIPLSYADNQANTHKVFTVWDILKRSWIATDCNILEDKLNSFASEFDRTRTFQVMKSRLFHPAEVDIAEKTPDFPEISPDDIAFIQFSSGSTGQPKGVVLTHKNLLVNIYDLLDKNNIKETDTFLSWVPLSHDLGMIGFHLAPAVLGTDQSLMPTNTFIWHPVFWLSSVHKYQANILCSPNYGYRHFLKRFKRENAVSGQWDLSCVKVIINGGESISSLVCNEFLERMSEWGLQRRAMRPSYGLAEATLLVSASYSEQGVLSYSIDRHQISPGQPVKFVDPDSPDALELIDCGTPIKHTEVRITDEERKSVGEGFIGNIEVRGPCVTSGYYRNIEATQNVLTGDGWFNTQDFGFIHNGRLVFAGRAKELIIIGGANYFPSDIEMLILRGMGEDQLNRFVSCAVPNSETGTEDLVVFVQYKKKVDEFLPIVEKVRQLVLDGIGIQVAHVLPVRQIPKTTSGKIQRFKLVQAFQEGNFENVMKQLAGLLNKQHTEVNSQTKEQPKELNMSSRHTESIMKMVQTEVEGLLGFSGVNVDTGFFDLGLNSIKLIQLQDRLATKFKINLSSTAILDYPSIRVISNYLESIGSTPEEFNKEETKAVGPYVQKNANVNSRDIAVVGMSCRFPGGVDSPDEYWRLLCEGIDPVREIPKNRWHKDPYSEAPLTTRMGGYLDNIEQFDSLFFAISTKEAEALDPQHRLLLELTWEALEDAGWNPKALANSRTGVFVGISSNDYAQVGRDLGHPPGTYSSTGTMLNSAAGRISYTFGLQGPSMAIDTACSSSLVAVHQGLLQLRTGQCDVALVSGVNMILRAESHLSFSHLLALSPSGRCASFDESADGYIRSEGGAVLVLKRLEDAHRDGDSIWGVIKGAAVNHGGSSGGFTVPNGIAQQKVIREALVDAGLQPEDIDYIEAHGSGTKIGDPQEVNALAQIFGKRQKPLYLGSVKSNLGHLESAAGIASICKVLLALRYSRIPSNLHFRKGNPLISWASLPFKVVDEPIEWESRGRLRRAGISSFGISGTNVHVVLESVPENEGVTSAVQPIKDKHLCTLSARTEASLRQYVRNLARWCKNPTASVAELCQNLNLTRTSLNHRLAFPVKDIESLAKRLNHLQEGQGSLGVHTDREPLPLVFLFTGQGSHYHNMARELYEHSSVFREKFDEIDAAFRPGLGVSLSDLVYGPESEDLDRPLFTQPILFCIQIALAHFWESLGVTPDLVIGHSIGEYAAACLDGIMSVEDAIVMVTERARVMDQVPAEGRMVGILANESQAREMIQPYQDVSIAAINSPENVTVSGGRASMDDLVLRARKSKIFVEELKVSHPFHSVLMHEWAQKFKSKISGIPFNAPSHRFISTVSGDFVPEGKVLDAGYWASHLVEPVQFAKALDKAILAGSRTFLEIGSKATLCGLAAQNIKADNLLFLPSLREQRSAWSQMNESIGRLWEAGYGIRWQGLHQNSAPRIKDMPHTPYDRKRVWFTEKHHSNAELIEHIEAAATIDTENIQEEGLTSNNIQKHAKNHDKKHIRNELKERNNPIPQDSFANQVIEATGQGEKVKQEPTFSFNRTAPSQSDAIQEIIHRQLMIMEEQMRLIEGDPSLIKMSRQ